MPFIFVVPVWLLIVLAAVPLLFVRKLRFLAVHIVMARASCKATTIAEIRAESQ